MPERDRGDQRIQREARIVGLRDFRTPSLEAVEQRRMQLWIVTTILLIGVSLGVAVLSWLPAGSRAFLLSPRALRWGIVLLSIAFSAYAIEKELHLRRLARLLIGERLLATALENRVHEVTLLLEAGRAMNAVLELDAVLEAILRSANDLLGAKSASIMLVEGDELVAAHVFGNESARGRRVKLGDAIAGRVAVSCEPLLINGRPDPVQFPGLEPRTDGVDSSMSVPLVHREEVLGVLNVNADADREFTEYDLRALSVFAEQSAAAMANARLYEKERSHVAELEEVDRVQSEFIDLVAHELRTPLTAVVAAAETARRPEMREQLAELLDIVARNSSHLNGMLEELLTAVRLERGRGIGPISTVDVADLARATARDFALTGRPVIVDAPASAPIQANTGGVRRILDNLLDNAHKYGRPPVRLMIEPRPDAGVTIWVVDAGAGIPVEDRDAIFARFSRRRATSGKPGLGLGLAIVRGLAESFGGGVDVEDVPAGGAAFRVTLPGAAPRAEAV
ncbi:MAG: GAF domain-containing sensor histidine kinase [Actinomycetota bacterium]